MSGNICAIISVAINGRGTKIMAQQKDMSLFEFQQRFNSEDACQEHLFNMRWSEGFKCPRCGCNEYYHFSTRRLYQCQSCSYQASLTAGTIFHKTRTALHKWFWAIFLVANDKRNEVFIMKKKLCVILLLILAICVGCQSNTSNKRPVKKIDGVTMVPVKEMSNLLSFAYKKVNGNILLKQDNIVLKINHDSNLVYKDGYIMDILERSPADVGGKAYLPMSFFTNYLQANIKIDENKDVNLLNSGISFYSAVKFLPKEILNMTNNENYPFKNKMKKAITLTSSMNTKETKINAKKIIDTRPLDYHAKADLKEHGYNMIEIINFAYADYKLIRSEWKVTNSQIRQAKELFPELKNKDIRNWTNEKYENYHVSADKSYFTIDQIKSLALNYHDRKHDDGNYKKKLNTRSVNGVLMVSAKDISNLLKINFNIDEQGGIVFKEDNIMLKLNFDTPYVCRGTYILDVLEAKPTIRNDIVFIPLEFLTDYLNISLKSDNNQIYIVSIDDSSLYDVVKFLPKEVVNAIDNKSYPYRDKVIKAIGLPRSMNIEIPKINMKRIITTTPLSEFKYDFKQSLRQHGYSEKQITNFTYGDYKVIEKTWKIPKKMIKSTKLLYPELKRKDLSNWTYGDLENYSTFKDTITPNNRFTEEQKKQFKERGILLEDTIYLIKAFHQPDTILAQSNEVLKKIITGYYKFSINMLRTSKNDGNL